MYDTIYGSIDGISIAGIGGTNIDGDGIAGIDSIDGICIIGGIGGSDGIDCENFLPNLSVPRFFAVRGKQLREENLL